VLVRVRGSSSIVIPGILAVVRVVIFAFVVLVVAVLVVYVGVVDLTFLGRRCATRFLKRGGEKEWCMEATVLKVLLEKNPA
jgi:hypothetical protein